MASLRWLGERWGRDLESQRDQLRLQQEYHRAPSIALVTLEVGFDTV